MDPYTEHATEIAPALPCLSGGITHKGKVVEYIPELEAMEEMQDWAMGMGRQFTDTWSALLGRLYGIHNRQAHNPKYLPQLHPVHLNATF